MELDDLRAILNDLDDQIVDLLRRRADVAADVGALKRQHDLPYYQPERERQLLNRIANLNLGKFPADSAVTVFREIISACLALQQPIKVAFLGPPGTFTDIVARTVFGHAAEYHPQPDFRGIFEAVRRKITDFGLVPVENSTAGTIREVLDLLSEFRLPIIGEHYFEVRHCLLSKAKRLVEVDVVYSKDTALDQCRNWLRANLPHATLVPMASTADGARQAAQSATAASIGPEMASAIYDLPLLARNIEDRSDNRTRFFALGQTTPPPSGADKTSLILAVPHQPGALVKALEVLRGHGLNMTMIESRPSPGAPFEYVFFIDIEGHIQTPEIAAAIKQLEEVTVATLVLGSYPRASS